MIHCFYCIEYHIPIPCDRDKIVFRLTKTLYPTCCPLTYIYVMDNHILIVWEITLIYKRLKVYFLREKRKLSASYNYFRDIQLSYQIAPN